MSMAPMPSWRVRPGKLLSRDMPKKDESPAEERGLLKKLPSRIPINLPFSDRLQEVQAQALDDIGDTTRRLVEHDKKEGQTRNTLRRKVRVAAWFVQVLVFWGCWKLFNFSSHMSAITQRYDPKVGIDLEVRGCDVDFTAGDEPTVTYTARMMAAHASWHKSTSDSTSTQYATLSNKIGCGGLRPGDGCRRVCLVTVSVTPEAARLSTFRIDQEADDTDSPTISLMPQTSIATLLVSPAVDPPSMDLVISHASITSQLTAKLGFGGMTARRSSLPKDSAVEAVGSIYLYGVNTPAGSKSDTCTVGSDAAGTDWQEESRSTVPAWPGIQSFAGEVVDVSNPNMDPTKGVKSHDLPVPHPVLGIRDATRITEAYASDFGDRGSSGGSVYITFEIVSSDGLPAARFVYTTNPFFLYLDPAALLFLTAGVLVPPTFHEELHFTGFDCDLGPGAVMSTGARNATLIAAAHEIEKVLHSDPEDVRPLRGLLVFVGNQPHEHMPMLWGEPPLFEIPDRSSGQTRPKLWQNPTVASAVKLSLALVAVVGVLVGALATYAAFRYLSQVSIDMWMLDEANEKLVCMKRYAEEGEMKYLEERVAEGEERMRPSGNPFKSPFRLITKFSIVPLRKKLLDSLPLFIEANLSKVPVVKDRGMGVGAKAPQADRYIWMSDFLRHYELYCLDQNLTMEVSKEKIQQELVSEHGCSVKVLTLSRLYGLRWKTKLEPQLLRAIPEDRAATGKSKTPEKVVRDFIKAKCDVSGLDYIDLESRFGKYGTMEMGFGPALEAWAKQQGLPVPKLELSNEKWCKAALPEGVKVRLNMTAKQVRGLEFKKANDEVTIPPEWYMQEAAMVMMHAGLYVPPLLMAVYAMYVQNYYSIYICSPSDADPMLQPLTWLDANLALSELLRTRQMAPETRILVGEVFVFSLLTLVRQLFHYMAVEQASAQDEWSFRSVFKIIETSFSHVYGVIATLQIFVFTSFVGIVACWFLLATALDPTVFLPYGVAFVTMITVATTLFSELLASAKRIRDMLQTAFDAMLAQKIKEAEKKLREQADRKAILERNVQDEDPLEGDPPGKAAGDIEKGAGGGEGEDASNGTRQIKVSPEAIFRLLDQQGDGELTKEEFMAVFTLLDLNMSESQKERLFALCDIDCSGSVSQQEFVNSWSLLLKSFTAEGAEALGLGPTQIILSVAYIVLILGLVIAFILVSLAAWSNEDNFGAVIQSTLISGAGRSSVSSRSKSDAEDPEKAKELTEQHMDQQMAAETSE